MQKTMYKVILHSCEAVGFTTATIALKEVMNWDFFRAHDFCEEADKNGTSLLCIASSKKARDYVLELEENGVVAEQIPI